MKVLDFAIEKMVLFLDMRDGPFSEEDWDSAWEYTKYMWETR